VRNDLYVDVSPVPLLCMLLSVEIVDFGSVKGWFTPRQPAAIYPTTCATATGSKMALKPIAYSRGHMV
jgi:hypothetical protein